MRRINDYPVIPALAPVRPVRRPESYAKEHREGGPEREDSPGHDDNDKAERLTDNPRPGPPGRLLDEFA